MKYYLVSYGVRRLLRSAWSKAVGGDAERQPNERNVMLLKRLKFLPGIGLCLMVMVLGMACEELVDAEPVQDDGTVAEGASNNASGETQDVAAAPTNRSSTNERLGEQGAGGGFLWKPVSESNGRLVVLLPPQYNGIVSGCHVVNASGSVIESGRYDGIHNGDRQHYRFDQSGGSYGNDIYVVANTTTGNVHWYIANGSARTSY